MTIDVHCHCIPPEVVDTLQGEGGRYGIEILGEPRRARIAGTVTTGPLRADLSDLPARIAAMDAAGVDVQLLSSFIDMTAYALDPARGRRYARMFNESLAATAGAHPDRFGALATVPLQDPPGAAEELRYAVTELGMAGAQIATTVNGAELDDRGLDPFWAQAAELRCLILLHPLASLSGRGLKRYFLGNVVANPAETTIALAHLIFGGVLERFEDLVLCAVHGGGFLPYQVGRMERGYRHGPVGADTALAPAEALGRLYFDTIVHHPAALDYLIGRVGADRVVLGSDYPFEMGDPEAVRTVRAAPCLDAAQREAVLEGNLRRILDGIRR